MKPSHLVLALPLLLSACALDAAEDADQVAPGGKADDVDPALVALAREYAEEFDFQNEFDSAIPRDEAATIGPLWVDRAYAIYRAWEEDDLGSAHLYRWTLDGRRVWAIRTSTDGDESYIELFDAEGDWLSTGTGGFADDPDAPEGFGPVIFWDERLGDVRNGPADKAFADETLAFWAEVEAATAGGENIGIHQVRRLVEPLFSGFMTTHALEGWEARSLWRALADRSLSWTWAARDFAVELQELYRDHFPVLGSVTTPSITTVLGIPAALAPRIRFARATLQGSFEDTGVSQFVGLTRELGSFPSSSTVTTAAHLDQALRQAGCTAAQAAKAVHAVGADHADARVAVASIHTIGDDFWPVVQPGSAWFIATPARKFISALTVVDAGESVAGWQALGDAAVLAETGAARPSKLIQVRKRADRTWLDLSYTRPDQGMLEVVLELPRSSKQARQIHLRAFSPSLDPDLRSGLAGAISGSSLASGEVDVLAATAPDQSPIVAIYRPAGTSGPARLAEVDFAAQTAQAATPDDLSDDQLEALALSAARHHAEQMVQGQEPVALVEVLLRTAWASVGDLVATDDPDESPVGFDPGTERAQYMLARVWGDMAVFVTFADDGAVRVEDFN